MAQASNVLLVCGENSYDASGARARLEPMFEGKRFTKVSGFEINPKLFDLVRTLKELKGESFDVVLAVGGGSSLDMGKLLSLFLSIPLGPESWLDGDREPVENIVPLVAVPTTAGSGSEATHFAVCYRRGVKHSVSHPKLLPKVAVVDPDVLTSAPAYVRAACGMDALCQAIESYWNVGSTGESMRLARDAAKLTLSNLRDYVEEGSLASRLAMGQAAHAAGQAINITKTTAPHALSYTLSSSWNLAHGHAVAVMLVPFLVFNSHIEEESCIDPRGLDHVRAVMDEIRAWTDQPSLEACGTYLRKFAGSLGLEMNLRALGVTSHEDLAQIGNAVNVERLRNNPRRVTPEDIEAILFQMLQGS